MWGVDCVFVVDSGGGDALERARRRIAGWPRRYRGEVVSVDSTTFDTEMENRRDHKHEQEDDEGGDTETHRGSRSYQTARDTTPNTSAAQVNRSDLNATTRTNVTSTGSSTFSQRFHAIQRSTQALATPSAADMSFARVVHSTPVRAEGRVSGVLPVLGVSSEEDDTVDSKSPAFLLSRHSGEK